MFSQSGGQSLKERGRRITLARKDRALTQDQLVAKLRTRGLDFVRGDLVKIEAGLRPVSEAELTALQAELGIEPALSYA